MRRPFTATPMEARAAKVLPREPGWWFEPKWDGFRCLAYRAGEEVELDSKSAKSLGRFFPEVLADLQSLAADRFVVDGELLIEGEGGPSFEALQMRLHPAQSRVRRLAAETPAALTVFDILQAPSGADLRAEPLRTRRAELQAFVGRQDPGWLRLTPGTEDRTAAEAWLSSGLYEGVVAKRLDDPYAEGLRTMVKVKRVRTADCVVGGFRYARNERIVASLLLGLYNAQGRLDHVGHTSGLSAVDKLGLTRRLERLEGGPGFDGDAPGGPSRWATERSQDWRPVRPDLVVEVSFDHVSGGRFRHGTKLLRLRPDKSPRQCGRDQIR